jgi:hypothetical protein
MIAKQSFAPSLRAQVQLGHEKKKHRLEACATKFFAQAGSLRHQF